MFIELCTIQSICVVFIYIIPQERKPVKDRDDIYHTWQPVRQWEDINQGKENYVNKIPNDEGSFFYINIYVLAAMKKMIIKKRKSESVKIYIPYNILQECETSIYRY